MSNRARSPWVLTAALQLVVCICFPPVKTQAQVRGVYPLGMSATNSGMTAESGFTYSNQLLTYSRNQFKDPQGNVIATGNNSIVMDMNTLAWVSKKQIFGGARFSMSATFPVANNSLSSDAVGPISGGGGFADSYYQPVILGWDKQRVAVRAIYGFLAPTGRFESTANDNVGSGYWTHILASGQTFFLTKNKSTSVSAFTMYEFHSTQKGTNIHPGQNLDLDYSLTHSLNLRSNTQLQVGLVGYNQWQITDKTGPGITAQQAKAHYKVNAIGFGSNLMLPAHRLSIGFKYFKEFANRSTFQGYSIQFSGSIHF
jgi:hypothetical protein